MSEGVRPNGSTWDPVDESSAESFPASDPPAGRLGRDPEAPPASGTVTGVYSDPHAASKAVQGLIDAHLDPERDISVFVSRTGRREQVRVKFKSEVLRGAWIGALAGGAAGAALAILAYRGTIAGVAHIIADVEWVASIQGVLAGAATGYLGGGIAGLGFWSDEIAFGTLEKDATIWVGAHSTGSRALEARGIMQQAGALRFEE